MRLFRKRAKPLHPGVPVEFPSGLFVRTEDNVYYIGEGTKFPVLSQRVLDSWSARVLEASESNLANFKSGPTLGFRNGTLIKSFADSKYYLISNNKKRHIVNPDWIERFGMDYKDVLMVSEKEVNIHPAGEVIE